MKRLTKPAIKIINGNGALFIDICEQLGGIAPVTLRNLLTANNDQRLVSDGVQNLIRRHLKEMQDMKLTEKLSRQKKEMV